MGNRNLRLRCRKLNLYIIGLSRYIIRAGHFPPRYRCLTIHFKGQLLGNNYFRLNAGYDPESGGYDNPLILQEQYFDNLDIMGDDNPCFLGELNCNGFALFEWKYQGC